MSRKILKKVQNKFWKNSRFFLDIPKKSCKIRSVGFGETFQFSLALSHCKSCCAAFAAPLFLENSYFPLLLVIGKVVPQL